eukprot:Nitzschia sp. Nitz4//scaffold36_size144017//70553//72976//NITZ4_003094-RA/size144017-processed-gene-0.47-mRNA-1//1//CDS//3329549480//4184//frame0
MATPIVDPLDFEIATTEDDTSLICAGRLPSMDESKHSRLGGSPRSPKEMEEIFPTTDPKGPKNAPMSSIETRPSRSDLFGAIDRALENGGRGAEACEPTRSQLGSSSTTSQKNIGDSLDIRVFTLSLLKHGRKFPAAAIAKNSWKRHLYLFFELKGECAQQSKMEKTAQKLMKKQKFKEALDMYSDLEKSKSEPGKVAAILARRSILYWLMNNQESSLACVQRAVDICRRAKLPEAAALNLILLGFMYFAWNQLEPSLRAWREALQTVMSAWGYDHPYVATLLCNMGCLHYLQEDYGTSLSMFSEASDLNRKVLGRMLTNADVTLLDISLTKANMAVILARSDQVDTAAALLEEVLSLQESMPFGHVDIITNDTIYMMDRMSGWLDAAAASTAASSRFFAGKSDGASVGGGTADTLFQIKVEERTPSVFGNDDGIPMRRSGEKSPLDAVDVSDNLDVILFGSLACEYAPNQRVRATVLRWFGKTLLDDERDSRLPFVPFQSVPRKRTSAPVDLDNGAVVDAELYLQGINEQAVDFLEHDEVDEALDLLAGVLESHREKYGSDHHLVGRAHHNLGMVYLYAEKYLMALSCFQEAVTRLGTSLGTEHPAMAAPLMKMGMIFMSQRNANGAFETFERVLKILKNSMGTLHLQVARALNNIAVAQYDMGRHDEAMKSLHQAHDIQMRLLDMTTTAPRATTRTVEMAISNSLNNLGFVSARKLDYQEAQQYLEEAERLRQKHVGLYVQDGCCVEENVRYVSNFVVDTQRRAKAENRVEQIFSAMLDRMVCR